MRAHQSRAWFIAWAQSPRLGAADGGGGGGRRGRGGEPEDVSGSETTAPIAKAVMEEALRLEAEARG